VIKPTTRHDVGRDIRCRFATGKPQRSPLRPIQWREAGGEGMPVATTEFRAAFPGESQHVQFKRGTSMEQLQNTGVAFSNSDGGVILIGVQDDGRTPPGRSMPARRTMSTAQTAASGSSTDSRIERRRRRLTADCPRQRTRRGHADLV
jgi:hypothetical protein